MIGASASSPYIIRTSEKGPVRSKPGVSILNPNLQRHEQNSLYSTLNSSTSSPLLSNSQSTSSFFDEPQLAFPTSTRPPSRSHLAGKSFGQKFPSLLSEAKGREEVKCYIREEVLDPITNEKVNTIRPVSFYILLILDKILSHIYILILHNLYSILIISLFFIIR